LLQRNTINEVARKPFDLDMPFAIPGAPSLTAVLSVRPDKLATILNCPYGQIIKNIKDAVSYDRQLERCYKGSQQAAKSHSLAGKQSQSSAGNHRIRVSRTLATDFNNFKRGAGKLVYGRGTARIGSCLWAWYLGITPEAWFHLSRDALCSIHGLGT
jgi:hypothetical protein